jgi:hypothetical protein
MANHLKTVRDSEDVPFLKHVIDQFGAVFSTIDPCDLLVGGHFMYLQVDFIIVLLHLIQLSLAPYLLS